MSHGLEQVLANFAQVATLVKDRPSRQIWRLVFNDRPYYVKFYPRTAGRLVGLLRGGSPAWREFDSLRRLQKAGVPAPRAVAYLSGFVIGPRKGDAVVLEGIEPSRPLDQVLNEALLEGRRLPGPQIRRLVGTMLDLLERLRDAGLGHRDLHLGNLLLQDDRIVLLDGYAVTRRPLSADDLLVLGSSVSRYLPRTDLLRAWRRLEMPGPLPASNPQQRYHWRKQLGRIFAEDRFFGRLRDGRWAGACFKLTPFARRWAPISAQQFSRQEWEQAWAHLRPLVETDQLEVLKRSRSGDVLAGSIAVGGRPIEVIIKHPRPRYWHRYITQIGHGSRPWRAWRNAWRLIVRDVPTAWPLMMLERRVLGFVTDALIVFQRVPGESLAHLNLDELSADDRDRLFRRLGRTLRRLEEGGLSQHDAKTTNWMIVPDPLLGPVPVVIDVDGVRRASGWPAALDRLLRSLRDHPQYTPADSLALCRGYAPFARSFQETPATGAPA